MRRRHGGWLLALPLLLLTGCDDGQADAAPEGTIEAPTLAVSSRAITSATEGLTVVVTDPAGPSSPALDAAAGALLGRPGIDAIVMASGGDATASGYPVAAPEPLPADLAVITTTERVLGPRAPESAAVHLAFAAVADGRPALVVSTGDGAAGDVAGTMLHLATVLDFELHRVVDGDPAVWVLTVPVCGSGIVRGLVVVDVASEPLTGPVDCVSPDPAAPRTDVAAHQLGFATLARLD